MFHSNSPFISAIVTSMQIWSFLIVLKCARDSKKRTFKFYEMSKFSWIEVLHLMVNIKTRILNFLHSITFICRDAVNLAVLALKENEELTKLTNKWWYDRSQCSNEKQVSSLLLYYSLINYASCKFLLQKCSIWLYCVACFSVLFKPHLRHNLLSKNNSLTSIQNWM